MGKKIFTAREVLEKIQREMDTEEEIFIESPEEFIDYLNEGIDDAEAEILTLYEGYFNTFTTLDLVKDQTNYSLGYKNELQTTTFSLTPDSGTWTLTFKGQTTSAINFDATASQVQSALEALSTIGNDNIKVEGDNSTNYSYTFQQELGGTDVEEMTSASSLLQGATPVTITHATSREGGSVNIYANKINHVEYDESRTKYYKIEKIKHKDKAYYERLTGSTNDFLAYDIQYDSTAKGVEMVFYPPPNRSVTQGVKIWYIRNAERVSTLDDLVDCPEAHPLIFSFIKRKIALKESSPLRGEYEAEYLFSRDKLRRTLSEMIPDEDNSIEMDTGFYADFDSHFEIDH